MKVFFKILAGILVFLLVIFIVFWVWLKSTAPEYSGQIELSGIQQPTDIIYDDFGVPHIYAQNAHDAYFALGYAHAQERLFQMEMIRRATSGKLSEILGKDLLPVDKKMLTLSIRKTAVENGQRVFADTDAEFKKQALAYLDGVNAFIDEGNLPIEFTLIGFVPEHFSPEDIYTAIGYMSLSFTSALKLEPMTTYIHDKLGDNYLKDLLADSLSNADLYDSVGDLTFLQRFSGDLQQYLPVPVWEASNNWVISADRSESSKVLLANDTHIAYSQPSVWFEAHLNYPGFEMFGFYLAGIPFALIGHNHHFGWGLTIFPFDNMDLYREKTNPENPDQYLFAGRWKNFEDEVYHIKVKDGDEVTFHLKKTIHGPVLNEAFDDIKETEKAPVSFWWALHNINTTSLQALCKINNAKDMETFEQALSQVDIVGLNIVYGDTEDNIAWWAVGKIPVHNPAVNSKLILDGSDSTTLITEFYPFDKNPRLINPPDGFIGTSNNAPPRVDGILYPGYYYPGYRAGRVKELVFSQPKWTVEGMKRIQNDVKSERDLRIRNLVISTTDTDKIKNKGAIYEEALDVLQGWDGEYTTSSKGATIYTSLIYHVLQLTMEDELGETQFKKTVSSMTVRSALETLFFNENSPWWDNVNTKEKESREQIFTEGLQAALEDLATNLGHDMNQWQWGKLHTLTHVHPIGRMEPFDKVFNVGPFAKSGGNEVVDKEAFNYSGHGPYPAYSGPAMRLLIDFAFPEEALSVIPTGQSGNVMSPHYADQAEMFVEGKYKVEEMDKNKIDKGNHKLVLTPSASK